MITVQMDKRSRDSPSFCDTLKGIVTGDKKRPEFWSEKQKSVTDGKAVRRPSPFDVTPGFYGCRGEG